MTIPTLNTLRNTHFFEFDAQGESTLRPEFKAGVNSLVTLIRDNISQAFYFMCQPYRHQGRPCIQIYFQDEGYAEIYLNVSGYSEIPTVTYADLTLRFEGDPDTKVLKAVCHCIDSTDMLHMAGFLVNALNADPSMSIEKAELEILQNLERFKAYS